MQKISVIVPVLNEESVIGKTLSALRRGPDEELLVVDGGSDDRTAEIANQFASSAIISPRGRARQMNAGAEAASGDILLFLHADCGLPDGAYDNMRATLQDNTIAAGAFDLSIDHPAIGFRVIEWGANLRSHLTGIPYGDQGLFMRTELFRKMGGYADIPLMEDIELGHRLKRQGRIVFVRPSITTSPRRWLAEGLVYTTFRDWARAIGYSAFGLSPWRLSKHYRHVR